MKIVITGPKCSGKSTIGEELANRLQVPFHETDTILEQIYHRRHNQSLSYYEICSRIGEEEFREYENLKADTMRDGKKLKQLDAVQLKLNF